jgi:hypothetical protein
MGLVALGAVVEGQPDVDSALRAVDDLDADEPASGDKPGVGLEGLQRRVFAHLSAQLLV